ncbi:MAG: disulfide bond formation protein B [Methylophilales bacterium]|nr:disulfide bond formation protein B [Methylophilales bacterium]
MFEKMISGRRGYFLGFAVSFGLVGLALFLQQKFNLDPCPLCISQRIAFMGLGVMFLLAALHNPQKLARKIYAALQVIAALIGAGIASRHIWIQANPDKVMSECGAGFDYLIHTFPASRAMQLIFKGTGECSEIGWTLFGFTIPQMSLAAFVILGFFAIMLLRRK